MGFQFEFRAGSDSQFSDSQRFQFYLGKPATLTARTPNPLARWVFWQLFAGPRHPYPPTFQIHKKSTLNSACLCLELKDYFGFEKLPFGFAKFT
jgi:hypothetical protein